MATAQQVMQPNIRHKLRRRRVQRWELIRASPTYIFTVCGVLLLIFSPLLPFALKFAAKVTGNISLYGYNGNEGPRSWIHHHVRQQKPVLFVQPTITNRQRVSITCYRVDADWHFKTEVRHEAIHFFICWYFCSKPLFMAKCDSL